MLTKGQYLKIYGKIGDWYIVQDDNNNVGTVYSKYITETDDLKTAVTNTEPIEEDFSLVISEEEQELLNLINTEREKNNLEPLSTFEELQNVTRLKAEDLVKNNYFSHISPTYGTPYEMLNEYNIEYISASENIAGNSSIEGAMNSFMNSESHKNNILNEDFNYVGVSVVDSIAYGKIIVEIFLQK